MKRSAPHDLAAERAVLGAALVEQECWTTAADVVQADDFYSVKHQAIWLAGEAVMRASGAVDTELVRGQLALSGTLERAGGDEYLLGLTDVIPIVDHVAQYAQRVRNLAAARAAWKAACELVVAFESEIEDLDALLDHATVSVAKACEHRTTRANAVSMEQAVRESFEGLVARVETRKFMRGHSTGFVDLDSALGGMCEGDLIILAARPGMGKTSLAVGLCQGIAEHAKLPGIIFSLEMPRDQLADRALSSDARVDLRKFRNAQIGRDDWKGLTNSAARLGALPIEIVDRSGMTVLDISREVRASKRRLGGLGLVVIDYLQLVRPAFRDKVREREVAEISKALKELAKEERVPVLALAQLNRGVETRADKRPLMADLRESGAIEQDADDILFVYRDDVYNKESTDKGVAEIIIAKQRNGPPGTVRLRFASELTRFDNLANEAPYGSYA